VKNATQCAKRLTALVKKLDTSVTPEYPDSEDPIAVLIMSFLLWESTSAKALSAYQSISESVVDFNDLRVCMAHETMEIIGQRYPRSLDRCQRLRAVLRDIYAREHTVSLERLHALGKREVRKYLDSLEGIVPYVAARVMLLSFQTHAVPVDDQLRTQLIEAGAADTSTENDELAAWLERQIKASESVQVHHALQHWLDELASKPSKTAKRTSKKKKTTTKKTSRSKKTTTKKKLSKA
jgi:endonuclease III